MTEPTLTAPLPAIPTTRGTGCPFDPPVGLRTPRPPVRLTYPDGHLGWLVSSRILVRAVLADPRFSARSELTHKPIGGASTTAMPLPAPPGAFIGTDPPVHTRYRHLLTGQFTVHRMRALTERVREITLARLDEMQRHGPEGDLVELFAQPISALVICELLGVPYADRDEFLGRGVTLGSLDTSVEQKYAAYTALVGYLSQLVKAKRTEPLDDLLSGLTSSDLTDDELTNIGFSLLGGGLDTTANMLSLGVFALLQHPDQLAVLRAEPRHAVEELLRYLSVVPCTVRAALEDVELGGELIRAGESVTVYLPAANRDPEHCGDPGTLDLRRDTVGHVAFGHGVHQCVGQHLARVEMAVAFPALFERFPTLRLAVEPEQVPTREDMLIYGVHRLPVSWADSP